jgi:hypothetical protein
LERYFGQMALSQHQTKMLAKEVTSPICSTNANELNCKELSFLTQVEDNVAKTKAPGNLRRKR